MDICFHNLIYEASCPTSNVNHDLIELKPSLCPDRIALVTTLDVQAMISLKNPFNLGFPDVNSNILRP